MATVGKPAASTPLLPLDLVFSSGNPRIEEIRGAAVFLPDLPAGSSSVHLPVGRKPRVCVVALPNMTCADFCRFCGDFVSCALDMRIVRNGGAEDRFSVLINFDTQNSADNFYKHFNGKQFSLLEEYVCRVRFAEDVQYTQVLQHAHGSVTDSAQQHTCPVCVERLDQGSVGVMTTICNHSFHYSCISKWTDSTCPVCRYCQLLEKYTCSVCRTSKDLWMCLLCGHIGCGRNKEFHDVRHWEETRHCYSFELETNKVWDYAQSNYVHVLIQSKADANSQVVMDEALLNNKCEAIVEEYHNFLKSQFEKQRNYYETLLLEVKEENEREIVASTDKHVSTRFQKLQNQIDKAVQDKKIVDGINENLVKDDDKWIQKQEDIKAREEASLKSKDEKIRMLEREQADLLARLLGQDGVAPAHGSISGDDIQGGTSTSLPVAPETSNSKRKK